MQCPLCVAISGQHKKKNLINRYFSVFSKPAICIFLYWKSPYKYWGIQEYQLKKSAGGGGLSAKSIPFLDVALMP